MSAKFTIAKFKESESALHVINAKNGRGCNCICYGCGAELESVQGKNTSEISWYYRHYNAPDCPGGLETALHQYAKTIIFDNTEIETPKKLIHYSNPKKEAVINERRSDVSANYGDETIHFEIVVTHGLSDEKRDDYRLNKLKCLAINLPLTEYQTKSPEEIKFAVLQEKENKEFVYWEDGNIITSVANSTSEDKVLSVVIVAGAFYLLGKLINSLMKSRESRF